MSNEKKKTIIFTIILIVVALAIVALLVVEKLKDNGTISTPEEKTIVESFNKYFNSKDKTVIYYASTECGWCKLQTPVLETIAEDYDMDYYYVNTAKLSNGKKNEIAEKLGIEPATPTTIVVEKGKVVDVAAGYQDPKDYVAFFIKNELIPEDAVYSKEKSLTFIEYKDYEKLISDSKDHVIVVGQTTCSHCIAVKPALNSIAEDYDLTINYLNINLVSQDEYKSFTESLKNIEHNEPSFLEDGSFGTPLILIVKKGKVSSYIAGERSKSQLVKEFKKAGLISE